ncbi:nucleotidyltransferase family protein [Pseudomonas saxonica]|nr:nucleotidyltransferase family protein [Pseudomonas saxonica]WRQ77412.1 nucleotidyltransferase family protein [Pseudomonas saxonica]
MVRSLNLPDCWIGAGFLRNAVWDYLHGRSPSPAELVLGIEMPASDQQTSTSFGLIINVALQRKIKPWRCSSEG